MLKNFINRVKSLVEQNKENKESTYVKDNKGIILKKEEVQPKEFIVENNQQNLDDDSTNQPKDLKIEELSIELVQEMYVDTCNNNKLEELSQKNRNDRNESKNSSSNTQPLEIFDLEDSKEINEEIIYTEVLQNNKIVGDLNYSSYEFNKAQNNNKEDDVKNIDKIEEHINCEIAMTMECEGIETLSKEDLEYIKDIKIKRGKALKAIDVYTKEPQIFKTHKECSKKLKIPVEYIKENLKYGYTDYLGEAIQYLGKELNLDQSDYINYLDSNKTPSQMLSYLNNKIFTVKISEEKREEILCSEKIEPVKMHYMFECIDDEYDDYFRKYKSIIKRGGKKKIELVDKKGEVIEIFKSLDECANYIKKEKSQLVDMLKYKETKVGRYEIRYSLRNI